MGTTRTALIATIGFAAMGCLGGGELMPSQPGQRGGAGGAPDAGSKAGARGTGGTAGAAGSPGRGFPLVTNDAGWLEPNPAGAVGSWWATNDYIGATSTPGSGDCPLAGFPASACSTLTTPAPGASFRPDPNGRGMCTSGTSAQVITGSDGTLAWPSIWGTIIAFNIATTDPSPMPVVGSYDAPAHGITGFAFDIDAVPDGGHLRVMFATPGTENHPAFWDGVSNDTSPVLSPGHYEVRWPEVGGPFWFAGAPPFDPTKIEWVAFHVVSTDIAPVPFDFCLTNLSLLTD